MSCERKAGAGGEAFALGAKEAKIKGGKMPLGTALQAPKDLRVVPHGARGLKATWGRPAGNIAYW